MKCLKFEQNGEEYAIYSSPRRSPVGHLVRERIGRNKKWCLFSDDLVRWRPDCLRKVADFIDSLDTKEL